MKRRNFIGLSALGIVGTAGAVPSVFHSISGKESAREPIKEKERELNPNAKWMQDAKWGIFTHYMGRRGMTKEQWNTKVNSFQVEKFANQLEELRAPYFFITLGRWSINCAPNRTLARYFEMDDELSDRELLLSDRDLVADLAAELIPRGIRLCLYIGAVGRGQSPEIQKKWQEIIREWSERYGESISAWWIDGAVYDSPEVYKAFTDALKSGNPNTLVSYNTGPVGMTHDLKKPTTEYEDYTAGETNWHLPVSGFRPWDKKKYYLGPNISGDQLHFLTFMGDFWSRGSKPRFNDELAIGWNKHIANHGGTISWDLPLTDSGLITEPYMRQLRLLSKSLNK